MTIRTIPFPIIQSSSLFCLIFFSLLGSELRANETEDSKSAPQDTIKLKIIGSRIESDSEYYAANLRIISSETLEQHTGKTLTEVLSSEAGINVRALFGSGENTTVDMSGFGASAVNNTLILLDGKRLNDIDIAAIDFSAIPISFIERIEILPGTGSVLYGNGASGGSINIITKSELKKTANIALSTSRFSEPGKASVTSNLKTEKTTSLFAFESLNSDGYRENNEIEQRNILLSSKYFLDKQTLLYFTASADEQSMRLPGVRRVNPDPDANPSTNDAINQVKNDPRGTDTPTDFATQDGYRLNTGYKVELANNNDLNFNVGIRKKNQTAFYDDLPNEVYTSYLDTELRTISFTPNLEGDVTLSAIENIYTIGFDYYTSNYNSERSLNITNQNTPIHTLNFVQDLSAAYVQNLSFIGEKLILNSGYRQEKVSIKGKDRYDPSAPAAPFSDNSEAEPYEVNHKESVYLIGLKYQFTESFSSYIRQESSVRFETVDEMFAIVFDTDTFTSSSLFEELKPQKGLTNEAGINFKKEDIEINAAYFVAAFENEIHFDPTSFRNINLDDTKRTGARVNVNFIALDSITIKANSSYTNAEFDNELYEGKTVPLVPRQEHDLSIYWAFLNNYTLATTTHYVGKKYFDNDQSNTAAQIPSYTTTSIKLAWTNNTSYYSLAIYNLFDKQGLYDYGVRGGAEGVYNAYTLPTRQAEFKAAYTF